MWQATIELDAAAEDLVEEWLWLDGAVSVSSLPPHEPERRLTALFADAGDGERFAERLRRDAASLPGKLGAVAFAPVDPQAWQVRWRRGFQPLEVGGFRIVGEWESEPDTPRTLRVYPGQAFGTGQHETTRLMLQAMSRLSFQGARVLDAGCGSGILAIAAERLGAAEVFGYDIDPDCAENMRRHLVINRTERVRLEIGRLDDFQLAPFDIILANITINVLAALWPRAAALLKPNGVMIASGVLAEQRDEALALLSQAGFALRRVDAEGEWLALVAGLA